MSIRDIFLEGINSGWQSIDASKLAAHRDLEADVAIVGSGAGGGIAAEILAKAGLKVVLIEEGPLKTSSDFKMLEADAYPQLYQESAARKTKDKAINILQGRSVGGSTTVNWTSCFRTPPTTLAHWQREFGLADLTEAGLAPWFDAVDRRLGIRYWDQSPNINNTMLRKAGWELGISVAPMRRNVRGCWNLGYCGTGCPTNAKQSMLVTTIPAALAAGAILVHHLRAERLVLEKGRAVALDCVAMTPAGIHPAAYRVKVRAKHFVLAGGACCCAAARRTRTSCSASAPSCIRPPWPQRSCRMRSMAMPARRRRSTRTSSSTPCRWTGRSASSWRCRRCTRCCSARRCRASARRTGS